MRSDVGTVRERVGFLVVLRGTANSVHQFREPAVKVSIEFYAVRPALSSRVSSSNSRFIEFHSLVFDITPMSPHDMTASRKHVRSFNGLPATVGLGYLGNEQTEQAFIVG